MLSLAKVTECKDQVYFFITSIHRASKKVHTMLEFCKAKGK